MLANKRRHVFGKLGSYIGDVLMYVAFLTLGHFTATQRKPPKVFTHICAAVQLCIRFSHSSTSEDSHTEEIIENATVHSSC